MSSCDTCGDKTDEDAVVMTLLGTSTGSKYTECPPCALERADDEECGPKTVSIRPLVRDLEPRLSPGLTANSTVWADGAGFRARQWRRRGEA